MSDAKVEQLAAVRVLLVGCGKAKRRRRSPAHDLYTGAPFRCAWRYCERKGAPVYILSARHRLVKPDRVLRPYERHLGELSHHQLGQWGRAVLRRLAELHPGRPLVLEVHAGREYVAPLASRLPAGWRLVAPLEGLGLFERLAWYGARARSEGGRGR